MSTDTDAASSGGGAQDDYGSAAVTGERRDRLFRSPTAVTLAPDGRLLVANAEYFNSDGAPYYVVNVKRP